MKHLSNKKGISLIELLAAIFLASIALGLIAQMLTLFVVSSQHTILNNQANTTGLISVETIESRLRNFGPTAVKTCEGQSNCVIFEQQYTTFIGDTGIEVEYYDPPNYLKIEFIGSEIILTRETGTPFIMDLKGFTLDPSSEIKLIGTTGSPVDGEYATVIFEIVLYAASKDVKFSFTASYSFVIDLI